MTSITQQTHQQTTPLIDGLKSQNQKISELIQILEKIHAATEAGAVYENLSRFRNPYDQVSAAVQILSGVVGGSAWTNLEALRHFQQEIGPERRKHLLLQLAHEEWFSNSLMRDFVRDVFQRGHRGKVIQFTPWNSVVENEDGTLSKSNERFLTAIENMKRFLANDTTTPGHSFYFICTIIKQMNKGSVEKEFPFTRAVNIGFVKAVLQKNLDDQKNGRPITVDGFGAASNEAPSGDGFLPSGGKKTITNGKECYNELIQIILDAVEKIVNETEYTHQNLNDVLAEMGVHFHAGEEYHEQVLNFLEAYVDDDRIPWRMKTIGHGVPQLGYACLHGTKEQKDQAYRIIGKIIDKKILMEYCPTSNKSIESTKSRESEDLHFLITNFLNMDQCITIGTDDPGLLNTSLEEEYNIVFEELVAKRLHKDVCAMTIRKFMSNSLKFCKTTTWTDDKLNITEEKFPKVDTHTHIGALFKIPFLISELETLHTHIQELIRKTERVTNRLASSS
jgi:hypothetical protein